MANRINPYSILSAIVGIVLIFFLREVLAIIFFSILVGTLFSFPVNGISRHMPRGLAVLFVLFALLGSFAGLGFWTSQPILQQFDELKHRIPEAINRAKGWIQKTEGSSSQLSAISKIAPPRRKEGKSRTHRDGDSLDGNASDYLGALLSSAGHAAGGLVSFLSMIVIIIVLAAFFAHSPRVYHDSLKNLVPKDNENHFEELWNRLSVGLRHWLGGILISMTVIGMLAAIGLGLIGVREWALLGVLTFMGTFIPYVGAISSAIPGLLLALAQSSEKFLAALAVYIGIHIIEGYIVSPFIMKRAVIIRPATLLGWQLVMAALLGIPGVIVATPLLVCVKITTEYLYIENKLRKKGAEI